MRSCVVNLILIIAAVAVMAVAPEIIPRQISHSILLAGFLALLVGTPLAVLFWFGRLAERRAAASTDALWQRALRDAEIETGHGPDLVAAAAAPVSPGRTFRPAFAAALVALVVQGLGLAACAHGPRPEWKDIEKGMLASDVVAMLGAPDHVQSNKEIETWQYCRDFFGYFADQYAVIWMQNGRVASIHYYKNLKDAGCQDFFRTVR